MTVLFRCRIEKPLLDKADQVTDRLGTSTAEMVRLFVTQIAQSGKVPLTLAPAESEEELSGSWASRAATLESFYDRLQGGAKHAAQVVARELRAGGGRGGRGASPARQPA